MEEDRGYTFEGTVCGILLSGIKMEVATFLLNEIRDTSFLSHHIFSLPHRDVQPGDKDQ